MKKSVIAIIFCIWAVICSSVYAEDAISEIGYDGNRNTGEISCNAKTVECYVVSGIKTGKVSKNTVELYNGNEREELLSVSYDFSLSAIVLVPKEELISNTAYTVKLSPALFENPAGENTEKQFVTARKSFEVTDISCNYTDNVVSVTITADNISEYEENISAVCTVYENGVLTAANGIYNTFGHGSKQSDTINVSDVKEGSTVNVIVWNVKNGQYNVLKNMSYTAE